MRTAAATAATCALSSSFVSSWCYLQGIVIGLIGIDRQRDDRTRKISTDLRTWIDGF